MMSGWLYAVLCVVLPGAWGLLMYFLFGAIDKRRKRAATKDLPPPIDYSI